MALFISRNAPLSFFPKHQNKLKITSREYKSNTFYCKDNWVSKIIFEITNVKPLTNEIMKNLAICTLYSKCPIQVSSFLFPFPLLSFNFPEISNFMDAIFSSNLKGKCLKHTFIQPEFGGPTVHLYKPRDY